MYHIRDLFFTRFFAPISLFKKKKILILRRMGVVGVGYLATLESLKTWIKLQIRIVVSKSFKKPYIGRSTIKNLTTYLFFIEK